MTLPLFDSTKAGDGRTTHLAFVVCDFPSQFEIEIQKVHDSYESLVKQSQRRESLEKIMRFRLEAETRKLSETNKELKGRHLVLFLLLLLLFDIFFN